MNAKVLRNLGALTLAAIGLLGSAHADEVAYRYATVEGIRIFYREAGDPAKPTILLLHGFPSSSHMFRDLIPKLASDFHLIAPDYPGMGYSEAPAADKFRATFDNVAVLTSKLVEQLGPRKVILYEQDFGGPVGMQMAVHHPDRVAGLIIQNTPISLASWQPARLKTVQASGGPPTPEKRAAIEARVVPGIAKSGYLHGARNPSALNPDAWANDEFSLANPDNRRIMTDLLMNLPTIPDQYPAWHSYLRQYKPKTLVVWGSEDSSFTTEGAFAVKKEVPEAEVHLFNTGHFALEEDSSEIARLIIAKFAQEGAVIR